MLYHEAYLPSELSDEEKEEVWTILQKTPIEEIVTQPELDDVERIADEWFEDYGIDIVFTKHFIERVNDERNGKPISAEELEDLFTQTAEKYGEKLANLPDDYQAVLLKLRNDLNLPFALNYDDNDDEMDLVAKTVMRKKNFQTSNPKLALEEMYAEPSKFSYPPMIKSLTEYMLDKGMNIRPLPKVKLTHDTQDLSKGVFVFEIFMSDESRGITAPKGFENLSVQLSGIPFLFAQIISFRIIQPLSMQPIANRCGISNKHLFNGFFIPLSNLVPLILGFSLVCLPVFPP